MSYNSFKINWKYFIFFDEGCFASDDILGLIGLLVCTTPNLLTASALIFVEPCIFFEKI